jgi:site-specific recombinase XerC
MRGRPVREVQELLGHKSIQMTEWYAHLSPDHLDQAVAVLDEISTTSAQTTSETPLEAVTAQ